MFSNIFTVMPFMAGALSQPLNARAIYDFSLYAYGQNVSGFPVIAINNIAYVSSAPFREVSGAANVTFNALSTRGNFTAEIDGEGTSLFYVPSDSGSVGFTNITDDSSMLTSNFGFYGHVVFYQIGTSMLTEWYAVPTGRSGLWEIQWNAGSNGVPIALRKIAPEGPTSVKV